MKRYIFIILVILSFHDQGRAQELNEAKGLLIGDKVENFTVTSSENQRITLNEMLADGPVVLVFYRGEWCPICNRHLQQLQDSLQFIKEKGANMYAISPDDVVTLVQNKEKDELKFTLLSDPDFSIADQFDVNFVPSEMDVKKYNQFLNAQIGPSDELPIPAVFIINEELEITWRFFNPDYRKRASVKDILDHL